MNKALRGSSLALALLLSDAQAVEQLTEVSGAQGPAVFFTGFCAERVGMKVISGRGDESSGTADLVAVAEQSAKYLLARCPQLREITADLRSYRNPTAATYVTLSRTSNWKAEKQIGIGELQSLLDGAGYRVFAGPRPIYAKAYWRLEKGRFDVVYGNDLENRMVATHIERHGEGDYRIRGQLYDLGYNESGIACNASREGYALWGSFTMTVSAALSSLPLQIRWCENPEEPSKSLQSDFFDMPAYGAASSASPTTPQLLVAALASAPGVLNAADAPGSREPLIDREFYRIYASRPDVCEHYEFDLVYRVNHERRGSVFNDSFDASVSNVTGTLASRLCGEASAFTVNTYSVGDPERWDSIEYRYIANAAPDEIPFRVKRRAASKRAKAFDEYLAASRFGPCEGPFCELPGGRYLNAIYRGDLQTVRQIDGLHQAALYRFNQRQQARLGGGALAQGYASVFDPQQQQLLKQVANKYLHAYAMWGASCLDGGAEEKTYEYTTPVVIETDEYGTTTSGGVTFKTTYTVNREFFPLRDQLATYKGAARSDDPANLDVKGPIFEGIVALTERGDCRSPEVKELERQLRQLTAEVIRSPGALPATDEVRAKLPERSVTAPFAPINAVGATQVAWNAPVPLPDYSTAAGTEGTARLMNQQERLAKANEEMKAAQKRFDEKINSMQSAAAAAARAGKSQAEVMKILQEGQAEILQLQQQLQEEMFRIQQKYL